MTDPYQEQIDEVLYACNAFPTIVQTVDVGLDVSCGLQDDSEAKDGSCGCPTEATESADDLWDAQDEIIVQGKYVESIGKWPAGMYAKLFDTLEEMK